MSAGPALPDLQALTQLDARLRGRAADRDAVVDALRRARAALEDARRHGDRGGEQRLLGYVGNALRLLGETAGAIAALEESVRLADQLGDEPAAVVARTRFGDAWRCGDRPDVAEPILRQAAADARSQAPELLHFALQHLGKCLLDGGERVEARTVLTEALELRRRTGDPELVASTEAALRLLDESE